MISLLRNRVVVFNTQFVVHVKDFSVLFIESVLCGRHKHRGARHVLLLLHFVPEPGLPGRQGIQAPSVLGPCPLQGCSRMREFTGTGNTGRKCGYTPFQLGVQVP